MNITETNLKGCFIIEPTVYKDDRGYFLESYRKQLLDSAIGHEIMFVQDNQSVSKKGVLRGLHFQKGAYSQAKLVQVIKGKVVDVVVDIRKHSETFGQHFKIRLSDRNNKILFIPKGMAHGFLSLTDETIFTYKCDEYYNQSSEGGIIFNDSELNIDWEYPLEKIILSQKDLDLPSFKRI